MHDPLRAFRESAFHRVRLLPKDERMCRFRGERVSRNPLVLGARESGGERGEGKTVVLGHNLRRRSSRLQDKISQDDGHW